MFDSVPSATTSIAMISEWSSPLLGEYWEIIMLVVGIMLVFSIIALVLKAFSRFGHH